MTVESSMEHCWVSIKRLPNPIKKETNANIEQIPGRMLWVFPIMNQKCRDYKYIG